MTRATSWTPDRVALLGTMPDAALARLIGLSTGAVLQARRSRKIPVYSAATSGVWVPLDPTQRERWQAAADAVGLSLAAWIASAVDGPVVAVGSCRSVPDEGVSWPRPRRRGWRVSRR